MISGVVKPSLPPGCSGAQTRAGLLHMVSGGQLLPSALGKPKPEPQESLGEGPSHPGSPWGGSTCELCAPAAGATPDGKRNPICRTGRLQHLLLWFNVTDTH